MNCKGYTTIARPPRIEPRILRLNYVDYTTLMIALKPLTFCTLCTFLLITQSCHAASATLPSVITIQSYPEWEVGSPRIICQITIDSTGRGQRVITEDNFLTNIKDFSFNKKTPDLFDNKTFCRLKKSYIAEKKPGIIMDGNLPMHTFYHSSGDCTVISDFDAIEAVPEPLQVAVRHIEKLQKKINSEGTGKKQERSLDTFVVATPLPASDIKEISIAYERADIELPSFEKLPSALTHMLLEISTYNFLRFVPVKKQDELFIRQLLNLDDNDFFYVRKNSSSEIIKFSFYKTGTHTTDYSSCIFCVE